MRYLIFTLIILTTACSHNENQFVVEDNLESYVDNFFNIAQLKGKRFTKDNLIIKLTHDLAKSTGYIGATVVPFHSDGSLAQRVIQFDYDYWIKASESQKESLSLHEFGHGYLYRQHTTNYSIMNIKVSQDGIVTSDKQVLIDELFKNTGQ